MVSQKGQISSGLASLSITYALQITQLLVYTIRIFSNFESNIISVEGIKK